MKTCTDVYGRSLMAGDYVSYIRIGKGGFIRLDIVEETKLLENKVKLCHGATVMASRCIKMDFIDGILIHNNHIGKAKY